MTEKGYINQKNSESADNQLFIRRYPPMPESSELVVVSHPDNYSAERIARAVEDCDAHLINLNVTRERSEKGDLIIDLRVNCKNSDAIARSLDRYGYDVISMTQEESQEDETARLRAMEILRLLEI